MSNDKFINLLQKRSFSEKLDETFNFIKQNFKPLIKALIYIAGPVVLAGSAFFYFGRDNMMSSTIESTGPSMSDGSIAGGLFMFLGGVLLFLSGVVVNGVVAVYMRLYQKSGGQRAEVNEVYQEFKRYFGELTGTYILVGIIVAAGFLFFIIPGIYLVIALSVAFMVIVWEDASVGDAISRSISLIKGNWWKTLGFLIVLGIIQSVIQSIIQLPATAGNMFTSLHQVDPVQFESPSQETSIFITLLSALFFAAALITQSITGVGVAFHYFSILEEKEAPGLMEDVSQFGEEGQKPDA